NLPAASISAAVAAVTGTLGQPPEAANYWIGIGARIAPGPLPHRRTCGTAYNAVCERLLNKWQDWPAQDLALAARMCVLAPHAAKDPERLVRLMNRAAQVGPGWYASELPRY
ncbi:MAG: hypothetical protein ABI557_19550, partial [Aureliella sp.]